MPADPTIITPAQDKIATLQAHGYHVVRSAPGHVSTLLAHPGRGTHVEVDGRGRCTWLPAAEDSPC